MKAVIKYFVMIEKRDKLISDIGIAHFPPKSQSNFYILLVFEVFSEIAVIKKTISSVFSLLEIRLKHKKKFLIICPSFYCNCCHDFKRFY